MYVLEPCASSLLVLSKNEEESSARAKIRMHKQLRIGTSPMHEEQLRIGAYLIVVLFCVEKSYREAIIFGQMLLKC